ncbi:hypothetical protein [uncultured Corynebacterium sp.]|uniref:putative PDDEXK endonuclease n=1 Tax=uncultured Corynebacterium sp. TaxID=159447 RepID=UPI00259201C1|nr:hypothetical protein [uncultured Corynebacterium sp.]
MARTRRSAKAAGGKFERDIADYLRDNLDDRIDRRVKTGAKDKGDIANVRDSHNNRIVIECKNVMKQALPEWVREAQLEAANDDALVGVVAHKRHGVGDPSKQWVTMTLDDLLKLLKGKG